MYIRNMSDTQKLNDIYYVKKIIILIITLNKKKQTFTVLDPFTDQ